jgi:hypothetical protein
MYFLLYFSLLTTRASKMHQNPASSASATNADRTTASNETITCSERRARLKAKQAEFRQLMDSLERERADHERRLAKIREEHQQKYPDVPFPTFEEMKDVVELSRTLSAEIDSARDMATRHNAYISALAHSNK